MESSEVEQSESEGEAGRKRYTKRQWILLVTFAFMNLMSTVCASLQAPFYPAEAQRKGATVTENGFVFGIFEFTIFVISKLGPKRVFCVCVAITSFATISFGFLDKINNRTLFVALSLLCRVIEGLGCSGFTPATFTIIACEFPDAVATTFASLETFAGVGFLIGPALGGVLYTVGGFTLPFTTLGALFMLVAVFSYFTMPTITDPEGEEEEVRNDLGLMKLLKIPVVFLVSISLGLLSMSSGVLNATLEPHIRQFQLSPLVTSTFFIVIGGMYAISSPFWGYICDRLNRPVFVTLTGVLFNFLGFLIIGPVSFLPFNTTIWVTIVGLAVQGIGFAACLISVFAVARKEVLSRGYPDNLQTNGVISGLWESMFSFGAWSGPAIAGVLFDNFGFRKESLLPLVTSFILGMCILLHILCSKPISVSSSFTLMDSESQSQSSPLLSNEETQSPSESPTRKAYGSISMEVQA